MKLVLVSDTHASHDLLDVPACDVLVHAGDFTRHGTIDESIAFFRWLGSAPARAKIVTAGNHDTAAAEQPELMRDLAREHGVTWLIEEGAEVLGLRVWASPLSPRHGDWVFQEERGAPSARRWTFPAGLDLLVTHAPPHGVLDRIIHGDDVGCEALLEAVRARPPRLHVFGHVHEAHGEASLPDVPTRFINASSFISTSVRSARTLAVRPPTVVDL
jgi:Icc-related predicted phosphoesterase